MWASSTVIWSVVVVVLSSGNEVGLALNVLVVLLAAPATKVTVAVLVSPAKLAVTVTVCASVLVRVTEHRPDAVLHVPGVRVKVDPVLLNVTACPVMGLFCASATVICRLVVLAPSAVTVLGVAVSVL